MLPSGRINCDMARSSMNESGYVWRDKLTHNVPPICLWFDTFPGLWGQRTTPCAGKRKMKQNLLDEWMTLVFSRFKELCGAWINTRQIYSSKPTFPEKINNDEVICSIGRKWSASPKRASSNEWAYEWGMTTRDRFNVWFHWPSNSNAWNRLPVFEGGQSWPRCPYIA